MPQLYVLRRFSSWSFRLSVSVALLVSSAGLAASLLVGAAISHASAPSLNWAPATTAAQPASGLSAGQQTGGQALPESLSNRIPAYYLVGSPVAGGAVATGAGHQLADQPTSTDASSLSTTNSLQTTIRRSWRTFKLAFR